MKNFYFWYKNILTTDLIYKLNLKNPLCIPKIDGICLNVCLQSIVENPKTILYSFLAFKILTYQVPTLCKAKKSLSSFNLRKNMLLGVKANLRKKPMYNFLSLFVLFVLPTTKNLPLISKTGCISIGIKNILSFPQLSYFHSKFFKSFGCVININLCGINNNPLLSKLLLTGLQLPL